MFKKVFLLLLLPISLMAAHKHEYVDASEYETTDVHELLHKGRLPIILNIVHNKRNEPLSQTQKQNLELSSAKFNTQDPERLKSNISDKENIKLRLSEYRDYYLKVPGDNSKFLLLKFSLIMGDKGPDHLILELSRFMMQPKRGFTEQTFIDKKFVDLKKLVQDKKKELESVQLNIVVDGPKMEASKVEAVPVFKEDNGASKATSVRPS